MTLLTEVRSAESLLSEYRSQLSRDYSPSTVNTRLTYARQLATSFDLLEVTSAEIDEWLASKGWKPETFNSALASLKLLFRWLVDNEHRSDDPVEHMTNVPLYRPPRVRPRQTRRGRVSDHDGELLKAFGLYLERRGYSPETVRSRLSYVRRLLKDVDPHKTTGFEIEEWVYAQGWKPNSINGAITAIRKFFKWMADAGHRSDNPTHSIETITVRFKRPRVADEDAIMRGIAESDLETQVMILLAAECGLRRAEIARVHRDDIRDGWLTVHGKGGRERTVRLTPSLLARIPLLEGWGYLFPGRQTLAARTHGTDAMFQAGCQGDDCPGHPTHGFSCRRAHNDAQARYRAGLRADRRDGSRHVDPNTVGTRIRRAVGNPHSLRHRAATSVYRGTGNNIRVTQEFLGHASPAMTARYVHVNSHDLELAATAAQLLPGLRT